MPECWRKVSPASAFLQVVNSLLPDGQIQGCWTQKWSSKISCGLGNQRPRKWPNPKFPNCGIILTIIGKDWPKNFWKIFFYCTSSYGLGGGRLAD